MGIEREDTMARISEAFDERDACRETIDTLTARVAELERERDGLKETVASHVIMLNGARCSTKIAESERDAARAKAEAFQKEVENCKASSAVFNPQQSPDGLSAILDELAGDKIRLLVYTTGNGNFGAELKYDPLKKQFFDSANLEPMIADIERVVCEKFPDSSFARRRAEATVEAVDPIDEMLTKYPRPWTYDEDERHTTDANGKAIRHVLVKGAEFLAKGIVAAVNAYVGKPKAAVPVTPAPAAADPARELLDAGEWSVKSEPYSSAYCVMAGNEFFCHCTNDDLDQFVALCAIVNRYRAIESAVNGSSFVRETIMSNLGGSTWESLHAALRPLLRTSEKEA